jgi:KUP system potassium uptake protein
MSVAAPPDAVAAPVSTSHHHSAPLFLMTVGAIGVVFGDIGTSPLYALKEIFNPAHNLAASPANVLGALSLIFWALMLMVTIKYVLLIMRADNHGEGGIMALVSLALRTTNNPRTKLTLTTLAILGAALFYGDSMITPAISVLSAVEGLQIYAPGLDTFVVPITLGVLTGLFYVQSRGTGKVATFFGPITCLWFLALAVLGVWNILQAPAILQALSPHHALGFLAHHGFEGLIVLGAVVLAVTGGEALYADMGHFGRRAIRLGWFSVVLPALLLNYFGQGALLLAHPEAVVNPFFKMLPDALVLPMVLLATAATIIASQAVISGAFSLTRQAIQLDYCPRMDISFTSEQTMGQIYIPFVNWLLYVAVVLLVLLFQSSSNLASAYGLAVTATMLIDSILFLVVARGIWRWPVASVAAIGTILLTADAAFLTATSLKVMDGGWFPLLIGLVVYTFFSTWRRGRERLASQRRTDSVELEPILDALVEDIPQRVPGTAVFFTGSPAIMPRSMLHNLKHNKVLHERVLLLTIRVADVPHVPKDERVSVEPMRHGFYRVSVKFGFKDNTHMPRVMRRCERFGLELDPMNTSYFLSRESIVTDRAGPLPLWRQRLFAFMSRLATSSYRILNIPTNQVLELGAQVKL